MVVPLDSPQPVFHLPSLADIPDTDEDHPVAGISLVQKLCFPILLQLIALQGEVGLMRLPELLFGAAAFSNQYNTSDHLSSTTPLRTVRLALR